MAFLKVQFQLLKCVAVSLFSLLLVSCQESKENTLLKDFFLDRDAKQQVTVPASFTPEKAKQLGSQVDSIFKRLHKKRGFNGTVLYTKYDQVILKEAYGYADFYTKDTLHTETAFQLASVSKQFTAMAIMMLKEQGKLQYDDSVQQYIPDFPYKGVTIRQLLTHRSGLPNYTYFSDKLWPDRKVPLSNNDVLDMMAKHQPTIYHKPNTHYNYSNTGYALLASVVEKVTDMPFAEYMQENIFGPLEMTNSFTFSNDVAVVTGKIATGHTGNRQKRTSDYLDTVLGDKGMYSTIEDLYKWDQALYSQKLVKWETMEEAFVGSRPEEDKKEDYGFGWRISQVESGDTILYHAGLWHGYTTYLLRNRKDHSALIVLSNFPNGSLQNLKEIRKFLYPAEPMTANKKAEKQSKISSGQP